MQEPQYHLNQQVLYKAALQGGVGVMILGLIKSALYSDGTWTYYMDKDHLPSSNVTNEVKETDVIDHLNDTGQWGNTRKFM